MKWFIVVVFNTFPGDVYIFHKPAFDDRKTCLVTLWESRDADSANNSQYTRPMGNTDPQV